MATTATKLSPPILDLRTPSTLPIRLGSSILEPLTALTSVRYNHKPNLSPRTTPASITRGAANGEIQLSFPANDGEEHFYSGSSESLSDTYVLLPRGREMLLERLSSAYVLNLVRGPDGQDDETVKERYPQITLDRKNEEAEGDGMDGDLFGEDDEEDAEIDPDNPFDWRHWLNKEAEQQQESLEDQQPKTVERKVERKVASSAPPTKKRKQPPVKEKNNPKRVKAGEEAVTTKAKPQRSSKPAPPEIRLDRKASMRKSTIDVDDSGELILEDDEATQSATTKPSAMSLALSGHLGDGPISLRSVASSPAASRVASPSPLHTQRPGVPDDGEEIDLDPGSLADEGDEDEEASAARDREPVTTYHFDDFDGDDDDDEEADADVEDLELPSPAQAHKPSVSAVTVTAAAAPPVEDDDDLGEALALALGADDDGGAPLVHESDEESEEE